MKQIYKSMIVTVIGLLVMNTIIKQSINRSVRCIAQLLLYPRLSIDFFYSLQLSHQLATLRHLTVYRNDFY